VRPVGAPDDPVGIGRDQRLGQRDHIGVIGRKFRDPIGAGNFHVGLARAHQLQQFCKARLGHAELALGAAEMVEYHRHRRGGDEILDGGDHRQAGEHLDVPVAALDAVDRGLKALAPGIGIVDAAGRKVNPNAAEAGRVHGVEIAFGRLVVDYGDPARGRAARLDAEQRGGVVRSIDARRDNNHALDVQRLMQRRHLLGRGWFRRIDAPGEEREFLRIAVNVGVAVGSAGRDVEIHRRRWLRRGRESGSVWHGYSGRERGKQKIASVEHLFTPWFSVVVGLVVIAAWWTSAPEVLASAAGRVTVPTACGCAVPPRRRVPDDNASPAGSPVY
jgi:hypothetical protein